MLPSPAALFSILTSTVASVHALPYAENQTAPPSGLSWAPCDLDLPKTSKDAIAGPIDCATLEVPLDYTNLDSKETLTLTLIKHNATKEPFKGSIIMNPGGPGASGIEEIATKGHIYRDEVFDGHFNVIGFDARGVGKTIPFACDLTNLTGGIRNMSTDLSNLTSFGLPQHDLWSLLNSKAWDDGTWYAESCANTPGNKDIGRYLGTAFTARDLLQIVDALNEDGLLRFWGRSYSTTLGQTFAAMFPKRIDRMLLDSVQRTNDYWSGSWQSATRGSQIALERFLSDCITAGPELCAGVANFTGPDTTVRSLMASINDALLALSEDPVYFPADAQLPAYFYWWRPGGYSLLHFLKYRLFQLNYRPDQWLSLYGTILSVLSRDWQSLIAPLPVDENEVVEKPWNEGTHNLHGIACADSSFRAFKPEQMYSRIQSQSWEGTFADAFDPQVWPCAQWKFEAAERYNGTFENINTSYPILFINSVSDPITPLSAAWEAAAGFTGSRLLVHKGHGHGFFNHPSKCTIKAVSAYFNNGTLPEVGTECEPDQTAFDYMLELLAAGAGNGTQPEKRGLNVDLPKLARKHVFDSVA